MRGRTVTWLRQRFKLEWGLITGAALFLLGIGTDAVILARWLASGGAAMDQTVHIAFVATTAIVLGLNVVFSSFLLAMLLDDDLLPR